MGRIIDELSPDAKNKLINTILNYDYTLHLEHDDDLSEWGEWLIDHDQYDDEDLDIICDGELDIFEVYELPQFSDARTEFLHEYLAKIINKQKLSLDEIQLKMMYNKIGV